MVSVTVIALAVAKKVTNVTLQFVNGRQMNKATRLLSPMQAAKANVTQFRYVAFAVGREACVVSITGYGAAREVQFQSPSRSCR
jgi:hypothetical protein